MLVTLLLLVVLLCTSTAGAQDLPPALVERFNEGVRAVRAHRFEEAEAAFRAVLAAGGAAAVVHHNLGIALQQQGRHADAVLAFRAALKLQPALGAARLLAGSSLLVLDRPKEARVELQRAVELLPDEPAARLQLAQACERSDDIAGVVEQYRALAARAPDDGEYAYRLSTAYLRLAQWSFERIRTIAPRSARLPQALAGEYLQQGRPDLAVGALEEAARRDPALPGIQLALARIHLAGGRLHDAARAIEQELVVSPYNPEARQAKTAIDAALARR